MRLHRAISYWRASTETVAASAKTAIWLKRVDSLLANQAIPLRLKGKTTLLIYTCAIAHRLAPQPHDAAMIAAQLVTILLRSLPDLEALPQGVTAQATATGLVHFEIGDRAIALWLDQRLANALPQQPFPSMPMTEVGVVVLPSAALLEAQYAYARCCSLLRLAHCEALISLEKLEESPLNWRFNSPRPFPWLTTAAQLSLQHPADRRLLVRLFEAFDHLYDPSQKRTLLSLARSVQAVAQAFQDFHRVHPLWQSIGQEPGLVTAQLGLLMATQRILYLLLAHGLHLSPAIEL